MPVISVVGCSECQCSCSIIIVTFFYRKANDQPVDLPVVINVFLGRAMQKRRPPPLAIMLARACVGCVPVRVSARLQRQASNHAVACVPA